MKNGFWFAYLVWALPCIAQVQPEILSELRIRVANNYLQQGITIQCVSAGTVWDSVGNLASSSAIRSMLQMR